MSKTVAIFGATGAQGAPVVEAALENGLSVRAIARDSEKITEMHPNATPAVADLSDKAAIVDALTGVDAAFLHFPMPTGPDDTDKWAAAFFSAAHEVKLPLLVYVTGGPSGDRFPSSTLVDSITAGMNAVLQSGIPSIVLQSAIYLENLQPEFFIPGLRSEGKLDYPPIPKTLRMQWTSHKDQAKLAAAALTRPDLAGRAFEIGTPDALTGDELAITLESWIGRKITFDPLSPSDFGKRIGDAFGSEATAFALTDLYGAIAQLDKDAMSVDIEALETTFGVTLTPVSEHIASWPAV